MSRFRTAHSPREQAAALLVVLAMVVLLTGLAVAYLSRTTGDRQVAQSSFHQSKVDQLAQSATDLVIGDLQTEIANGSSPTPTPSVPNSTPTATPFVYPPTAAANIVPVRNPTPTPGTTPAIPNLIRRSVRSDAIAYPAVSTRASAANSTADASANLRLVKLPRWNKHYLVPRPAGASGADTTPDSTVGFVAPDWVILTRNGPVAFSTWNSALADSTQSNNSYCVGRYAYAIYDEGGLLDANVAGFPTSTTAAQYGPKGTSAFADLTTLGLSQTDIDAIVGWRNYFSAGPTGNFPNFNFNAGGASNYVAAVLSNTNGFMSVPVPTSTPNNMSSTDQQFTTRQSLINLLVNSGLSDANTAAYALQYLGTFSRELNAPSWAPTLNAIDMGASNNGTGNIYAYKDNAANPAATPVNPNLLNVRVCSQNGCGFARADGTQANPGEPLINRRFPLTRLAGLGPTGIVTTTNSTIVNGVPSVATAATIQRDFGLLWNSTSNRWDYVGASGSAVRNAIERLDQVAGENREPNFFELLKAAILSGSLGIGSGTGNLPTFVAAEGKYYDTTNSLSSDYQIIQIGANIINQWDSGNVPLFFNFYDNTGNYELAGIKNLPYLNKLVFEPRWTTIHVGHGNPDTYQFDCWVLPSLWNPHQNAASASGTVQISMTSGALSAITTVPNITTSAIVASPTPISMTVNANAFAIPSAPTTAGSIVGSISQSPDGYYGFYPSPTPSAASSAPDNNLGTAYPYFGSTGCTFELRVQVNGSWKTYQRWKTYASPSPSPVVCQSPPTPKRWLDRGSSGLQDPEFVSLDPRTVRFGVWANAAMQSGNASDYTSGTQTTLDVSANPAPSPGTFENITSLPPQGATFLPSPSPSPTPTLYLYAFNTDSTVYYTDLDGVKRRGDSPTSGNTSVMQPQNQNDRPLVLAGAFQNGVFQSVAELGHVFRDQPWKTISFGAAAPSPSPYPTASPYPTPRSADAGLLDVFTLHESSIEAGKTSLNTKQLKVLQAILGQGTAGGAIKRLKDPTTTIAQSDRDAIATALQGLQPITNKAELVTRLAADSHVIALGNKEARDTVMRALSDAGQTRTWNLLIDLIAQSGRYPSSANSLAGFVVEGEVHYWVHVAIDRFTDEVIDKQIEVVNE